VHIQSLGYRTDLIFLKFDGEISDHGDHLLIRTPANPKFYWGNFLLFSHPPREGDFEVWRDLFAREIGTLPETEHQVFGWDSPAGETGVVQPFLAAGFRLNSDTVLTNSVPHTPARPSNIVQIRPLRIDADWEEAVELQVECREAGFEEGTHREFLRRQMDRYRRMVAAGLGNWFGAYADGRLVADLGLFHDGEVGRYQSVETHPDFRLQGIAGTLVYEASRMAVAEYGLKTLVIVAEEGSGAARLYASLGFEEAEKQAGLEWWVEMETKSN